MSILDWPETLENTSDVICGEFIMTASVLNPDHPILDTIIFDHPCYQRLGHLFIPEKWELVPVPEGDNMPWAYDAQWVEPELSGNFREVTRQPLRKLTPAIATHQVFWASKYGQRPVEDEEAAEDILWFFTQTDDPDHVAQLLICSLCLGVEPPDGAEDLIATGEPLSWHTYHKHMVADYYRALKETY